MNLTGDYEPEREPGIYKEDRCCQKICLGHAVGFPSVHLDLWPRKKQMSPCMFLVPHFEEKEKPVWN